MAGTSRFVLRSAPLALAAFLFSCSDDAAPPLAPDVTDLPSISGSLTLAGEPTGNYLFQFKSSGIPTDFAADVARLGGRVVSTYDDLGIASVTGVHPRRIAVLKSRVDVERAAADVSIQWLPSAEAIPGAAPIQLAAGISPPVNQSDQSGAFFFDVFQWNMRNINADDAWLASNQGDGVTVCVLDSGVDPGQLDMVGKVDLAQSASFVPGEPFIEDLNFHGTAMAGLITSRGIGTASVAPDARICAVKVLAASGSGSFEGVIAGIHFASHTNASVINMSLGAYIAASFLVNPGLRDLYLMHLAAVGHALSHGKLVVASSGNDGINLDADPFDHLHIPSQVVGVLSVGANGPRIQKGFDRPTDYQNYGITGLHVTAPGGNFFGDLRDTILAPCSRFVCGADGFYIFLTGTSPAAAHVSGAAAVLAGDGVTSPLDMAVCLKHNAFNGSKWNGPNPNIGFGRIDVLASVLDC